MDKNTIDFLHSKDEERMSLFLETLTTLQRTSLTNPNEYIHNECVDDTFTVWTITYDVSLPEYE